MATNAFLMLSPNLDFLWNFFLNQPLKLFYLWREFVCFCVTQILTALKFYRLGRVLILF